MSSRFLFVTGNSGGHLYPALALAECLNKNEFTFVINKKKISSFLLTYNNYRKLHIDENSIFSFIKIFLNALIFFKKNSKCILIATGAKTTIPFVFAAFILRKNIILLEQNTIPGRSNRLLQFFAKKIYLSFPSSASYFFNKKKLSIYGNPIRESMISTEEDYLKDLSWLHPKTIVVIGGSQGSFSLNNFFLKHHLSFSQKGYNLIVCCGNHFFKENWPNKKRFTIEVHSLSQTIFVPYIHNMKTLYHLADTLICRAGASTLSELTYYQKKAILIPYPFAKDNHQLFNAIDVCKKPHFSYIEEKQLNIDTVLSQLSQLKQNKENFHVNPNIKIIKEIRKLF